MKKTHLKLGIIAIFLINVDAFAYNLFVGASLYSHYNSNLELNRGEQALGIQEDVKYFFSPFGGSGTKVLFGVGFDSGLLLGAGYTWGKGKQVQSDKQDLEFRLSEGDLQVGFWGGSFLKPYLSLGKGSVFYEEKLKFNLNSRYSSVGGGLYISPEFLKKRFALNLEYKNVIGDEFEDKRLSFNAIVMTWY